MSQQPIPQRLRKFGHKIARRALEPFTFERAQQRFLLMFGQWPDAESRVNQIMSFTAASRDYGVGVDPDRELTLAEKYVLCAAIHDAVCDGDRDIIPIPAEPGTGVYLDYMLLKSDVRNWELDDLDSLQRFLGHVVEDLTANVGQTEQSAPASPAAAASKTELKDPIALVEVVKCIREAGRSDNLGRKMRTRKYPVVKIAGKLCCEREHVAALFPKHKHRLQEKDEE